MKIYSHVQQGGFNFLPHFIQISECQYDPGSIFWYDQHDQAINNISMEKLLDEKGWELLRTDPSSKIILWFGDEYYNLTDIRKWTATWKKHNIPADRIYLVCVDENWVTWTKNTMRRLNYDGINIIDYNMLMSYAKPRPKVEQTERKFSVFSRNYSSWRLLMYLNLAKRDLLNDDCTYTFNKLFPYYPIKIFSHEDLIQDAKMMRFDMTDKTENWLMGIPYNLDTESDVENVNDPNGNSNPTSSNKLPNRLYELMETSDINIVIESHFDPFWNFKMELDERISAQTLSPAFPTEKTYKPIACHRPFIMFTTPYFLQEFKTLGYKTFHPYIDESYDTIEDNKERLEAIANEVERLSNLPDDEYRNVITKCEEIAEHNFEVLLQKREDLETKFAGPHAFWNDIINPNWQRQ